MPNAVHVLAFTGVVLLVVLAWPTLIGASGETIEREYTLVYDEQPIEIIHGLDASASDYSQGEVNITLIDQETNERVTERLSAGANTTTTINDVNVTIAVQEATNQQATVQFTLPTDYGVSQPTSLFMSNIAPLLMALALLGLIYGTTEAIGR